MGLPNRKRNDLVSTYSTTIVGEISNGIRPSAILNIFVSAYCTQGIFKNGCMGLTKNNQPNLDCNSTFSIDLALHGIPFGTKSNGKV